MGQTVTSGQLKELYLSQARVLVRRPELARGAGQARVVVGDGLRCEIELDGRPAGPPAAVDEGSDGALAPDPAALMSASVAASLATGCRQWAALLDVPVARVAVEIGYTFDARGALGLADDVPAGWQQVLVHVTIASPAPEAALRHVVDVASRQCPMLANLSSAVGRVQRLSVVRSAPADRPTERSVPPDGTPPSVNAQEQNQTKRKDPP